ncbi:MAG: aminoacyl-tRNA hydrolase [Candidatus Omnitrophica bacterium]|nr:aminoacyl-tRNA hydrolase [Candidatus Omnitrophota bacterium]
MKFIIGIGNPGSRYEETRHNVGFRVVGNLAARWTGSPEKPRWKRSDAYGADVFEPAAGVCLLKSRRYVNRTGWTVRALKDREGAGPADILVVCDDVNLEFGKLRLRASGSAGGHHGLEDVIAELGSEGFPRLRIGVGSPAMPKDLVDFVLKSFDAEERKKLPEILSQAEPICRRWAVEGFDAAQKELSRQSQGKK